MKKSSKILASIFLLSIISIPTLAKAEPSGKLTYTFKVPSSVKFQALTQNNSSKKYGWIDSYLDSRVTEVRSTIIDGSNVKVSDSGRYWAETEYFNKATEVYVQATTPGYAAQVIHTLLGRDYKNCSWL